MLSGLTGDILAKTPGKLPVEKWPAFIQRFCDGKSQKPIQVCPTLLGKLVNFAADPAYENRVKHRNLMAGRQDISVKMFVHFYQQLRKKKFARYDYGVTENRRHYGTKKPPLYNLKKVSVPSITIFSDGDKLAPPEDALIFWKSLGKTAQGPLVRIKETNFVHEDFCINRTARKLAYEPLVHYFSL
ncbi:unnamed protein product [Allacma fusca]|uniref:Uncharacterized protein n=1 Tax=Allacma fusca TaxID=39272 RepID=A0A8J2KCW5_9HEXA|nr:unnamed protein product [Allacma fusca]